MASDHSFAHWTALPNVPGVWELTRQIGALPMRGVALKLGDQVGCVYSPPPSSGETAIRELAALGRLLLLAPNKFHTLGLLPYARLHPGSEVFATPTARTRIRKKTGLPVQEASTFSRALPDHVSLLVPPETRSGEAWLSVASPAHRVWIVGDAFLNIATLPKIPERWVYTLTKSAPGLSIGGTFKLLLKRRALYRDWLLAAIQREKPTVLVPCHGDIVFDERLPHRLVSLVEARL